MQDLTSKLNSLKHTFGERKGQLELLKNQLAEKEVIVTHYKDEYDKLVKSRLFITEIANQTQQQFKDYIEALVTRLITSVYSYDYKFICNFEIKRNKPECELLLQKGDQPPFKPKDDEVCGGIINLISYGLNIGLWSLEEPRSRSTFILDEPFTWVGILINKVVDIIKEINNELNLQLIMVTHDSVLADLGDKTWEVTRPRNFSVVKEKID